MTYKGLGAGKSFAAGKALVVGALLGVLPLFAPAMAQDLRLVMVEEHGCVYCERWNRDVSTEYPLTDEGRAAPLIRVNIDEQPPEGMSFARRAVFTPTFILTRDGVEVNRLEGYPGEDFFWGLLNRMIEQAEVPHG